MSYMPSNPHYAYVNITVGELNLTPVPPQHLEHFSYEKVTQSSNDDGSSGGNKVSITLHDSSAIALEYELSKSGTDLTFSYGYQGGPSSKTYKAMITEYDVDFDATGAVLTISATSTSLASTKDPKSKTYKNMNIDAIVKAVAKEEGWIVKKDSIEPTKPVYDDKKKKKLKVFYRSGVPAPQFINQVLAQYAKSRNSGEGGYKLYFKDSASGTVVYFRPSKSASKNQLDEVDVNYRFEYGTGIRSTVKSFNPEFPKSTALFSGASNVEASTINKLKNTVTYFSYDKNTDKSRPTTGDKTTDSKLGRTIVGGSSRTDDELRNIAANMWYTAAGQSYSATMTVLGDPSLEVMTDCSIVMLSPQGLPHHSSGIYQINSIVDDITGGTYESQLTLTRHSMSIGTDKSGGLNITVNAIPVATSTDGEDSNTFSDSGGVASNANVESAVKFAIDVCNQTNPSVGYSQAQDKRWGPNYYDCSGLVITAFDKAGFNVKSAGANSTSDMRPAFLKRGFKWIKPFNKSDLQRGDILLREGHHTEVYIGDGKTAGAHTARYPLDRQVSIVNYASSWSSGGILRYTGTTNAPKVKKTANKSSAYAGGGGKSSKKGGGNNSNKSGGGVR